jgi:hypothetical protein
LSFSARGNLTSVSYICENSKETQNDITREPNTSNYPSSTEIEPCFDSRSGNAVEEKSSTKTTQQRQAILAGFIGTALLVSSVALYILEMHVIAVVGGIVGLACVSFVLYNTMKPNTKFEKVEDVKQLIIDNPSLNLT